MVSHAGDRAGPTPRRFAALLTSFVVLATLALIGWSVWPIVRPARQVDVVQAVFDRAAPIQMQAADEQPARDVPTVQAPGWLEAEPFYVACSALADGVVERIDVLEGDFVERGSVVAKLVSEDSEIRLRRADAELASAEAALAIANADLTAAERAWSEPVELERAVEAGRAAVAESEAEIEQLPSLIESARATLIGLEEEADRARLSTERGASNELERIISDQRAAAQRAEVDALEARMPILTARSEHLRADLRAAERDLALRIEDTRRLAVATAIAASAEAIVARATALRDEAALELERMVIRAPISGYVQRRLKVPGDKVVRMMDSPHSAHLVHLYDHERIQVRVDVPLVDASHVSVGQACEVVVEVLPDHVFRGEVLRTTYEADLQKNTLQFKVKVLDPDPMLRPEMLTRVKFLPSGSGSKTRSQTSTDTETHVLVPDEALDVAGSLSKVWIVTNRRNGRGMLSARSVEVIARSDGWVTIAGNIQPGSLITVGVAQPREGEFVVIRNPNDQGARS